MQTNDDIYFVKKIQTKTLILNTSLELFAGKGVQAVSLRDIAEVIGIKSASIYYYYKTKELLLDDLLNIFVEDFKASIELLSLKNKDANTLEAVIRNIFDENVLSINKPGGCFGMALATREQHNNEHARNVVSEVLFEYSVEQLKADFDRLVEKGIIPMSDTKTISFMMMLCLIEINEMKVHEYMGNMLPIEHKSIHNHVKHLTAFLLQQGYSSDKINK